MPLRDHVRHWWTIVRGVSLSEGRRSGGIPVFHPNETRLRDLQHVVAIGMNDGVIPMRTDDPVDDAILPEMGERIQRESFADLINSIRE